MLETQIMAATAREWTTSEEADICCHQNAYELREDGWCHMEENSLATAVGDKLEPISDNVYRIKWAGDLKSEYGDFTVFSNLQQALDLFFNHR